MENKITKHERMILRVLVLRARQKLSQRNTKIESTIPLDKVTYQQNLKTLNELAILYDKLWEDV